MHKLTEKIIKFVGAYQQEQLDSIITAELKRMRDEIFEQHSKYPNSYWDKGLNSILGLEPEKLDNRAHSSMGGCHPECKSLDVDKPKEKTMEKCPDWCSQPQGNHLHNPLVEEKTMEWCEHIVWKNNTAIHSWNWFHSDHNTMINSSWNHCPICGTKKPKQKELRELLAEKMAAEWNRNRTGVSAIFEFDKLADIAISFLEKEGWKK